MEESSDDKSLEKKDGVVVPKPSRSGSPYLDRVREAIIRSYTAEYVDKKIGELCEAEDVRVTKTGDTFKTPNWKAREGGLKMIMQIQGISDKDGERTERAAPTNIILNIVSAPEHKPVVEVKEIKGEAKPDGQ